MNENVSFDSQMLSVTTEENILISRDAHRSVLKNRSESSSESGVIWFEDRAAKESLVALLSALYALVLLIFALTFELASIVHTKHYAKMHILYECFHMYLYGMSLLFFFYCYTFMMHRGWIRSIRAGDFPLTICKSKSDDSSHLDNVEIDNNLPTIEKKKPKKSIAHITHSGPTTGSLYLLLGCVVFGIVGIASLGLKVFTCIEIGSQDELKCNSLRLVKLIMGILFTFMQMHFAFQNPKMTIHRARNIGRFGTMHLIAVNLWVWMHNLIIEQYEMSIDIDESVDFQQDFIKGSAQVHDAVENDASAGGLDSHQMHVMQPFQETFTPILTTCIIEFSLIAAGVMFALWRNVGLPLLAVHKRKQTLRVDCSSSTTGLFVGLIFLVVTLVSLVVFHAKSNTERDREALWVLHVTDSLLYSVSIGACFLAVWNTRQLAYEMEQHKNGAKLLHDVLLTVGLVGQLLFCVSGIVGLSGYDDHRIPAVLVAVLVAHVLRLVQVLLQTVFILGASRLTANTYELQQNKPGRELVTFLMVVNISLFLVNIFETQKASANTALVEYYGESTWAFVVHSTMPLSIFYRFHSSVCLAEIWKHSYRVRIPRFTFT